MRRLALLLLTVSWPGLAAAEDVFIRVEAKRDRDEARAAALEYAQRTGQAAVLLELPRNWSGIALGPLPRETAEPLLAELRAERKVPRDSFVTPAESVTAAPVLPAELADDATGAETVRLVEDTPADPAADPAADAQPDASTAASTAAPQENAQQEDAQAEPVAAPEPEPAPPPPSYLRVEAFEDRAEADAALADWQSREPGASLWQLENGWHAIALGPMSAEAASAWRDVLRRTEVLPKDTLVTTAPELGTELVAPRPDAQDWPAPPDSPAEMPDIAQVQSDLAWAGHYSGAIDGKSGPNTRAAIDAEIAATRASTDPATAMRALSERRAEWRVDMGLTTLRDDFTGLALTVPGKAISFDRTERIMSIYGPKDGSGAALILFARPGGQQEMLDLAGLVTALGWVPSPERAIDKGRISLTGSNDTHIGRAEARVRDGMAEGFVMIWPAAQAADADRLSAEAMASFTRFAPTAAQKQQALDEAKAEAEAQAQNDAAPLDDAQEAQAPAADTLPSPLDQ